MSWFCLHILVLCTCGQVKVIQVLFELLFFKKKTNMFISVFITLPWAGNVLLLLCWILYRHRSWTQGTLTGMVFQCHWLLWQSGEVMWKYLSKSTDVSFICGDWKNHLKKFSSKFSLDFEHFLSSYAVFIWNFRFEVTFPGSTRAHKGNVMWYTPVIAFLVGNLSTNSCSFEICQQFKKHPTDVLLRVL